MWLNLRGLTAIHKYPLSSASLIAVRVLCTEFISISKFTNHALYRMTQNRT